MKKTHTTISVPAGAVLDLHGLGGLDEHEAARRLHAEGPNELPTEKSRGMLAIALEVAREPMFLMLVLVTEPGVGYRMKDA